MSAVGWTDDDSESWAAARVRDLDKLSEGECRDLLRRLAFSMAFDAGRREIWSDEFWAATTHG